MTEITTIGTVERAEIERVPPAELRNGESTIVVDAAYEDGLHRIEENDHLVVVFHLHRSDEFTLRGERLYGSDRGVFASRSPNRPGRVGVTTVELLQRDGRRLRVRGLDAVDGTPVLDLKPYVPGLDSPRTVDPSAVDAEPRAGVDAAVRQRNLESLFVDAAALHGGYCPLLAAGVLAGTYAARELGGRTTRGLVAGVESDGCLVDAVQYVLGSTLGNRRIAFRDGGALALTVVAPDGESLRIELSPEDLQSTLDLERLVHGPEADGDRHREAAFDLLEHPLVEVGTVTRDVERPDWLPTDG